MDTQLEQLTENEKEAIELFKGFLADAAKFRGKGTASAAVRARKGASLLTKKLKEVRADLQAAKVQKTAEKKALKATSCSGSCDCPA